MRRRQVAAHELLANVALFRQIDPTARARIGAQVTRVPLQRGEWVFRRGEMPMGFFVVVYGEIALSASGARGARLAGLIGPGRSFGEPVMFLGKPYFVDARAQSDALLLFVPKEAVFAELDRNPGFARRMIAGLAERIETLVHEVDAHARGSARDRLVDYLLRAAGARDGAATVQLPTTKAALASQLGLTAEHFSRLLHELKRQGLVRVDGRSIAIPNVGLLATSAPGSRVSRK